MADTIGAGSNPIPSSIAAALDRLPRPGATAVDPALGVLATLPLALIDLGGPFRLRPEGEVAGLAQSIAREGQQLPIEVRRSAPGRFQLVAGFRRVAALRLLRRDRVFARVHDALSDERALALALADDLARRPLASAEVVALHERLMGVGWYSPSAQEAIERAQGELSLPDPEPESEETGAAQRGRDVSARLHALSMELHDLSDDWPDVEPEVRLQLRLQLQYAQALLPFLAEPSAEGSAPGEGAEAPPGEAVGDPEGQKE